MKLQVNGKVYEVGDEKGRVLLWVLRDELGLTGTKFGCGMGICGSCTVHVDGKATRSCIAPLAVIKGRSVVTIEGLSKSNNTGSNDLHPVQQAFLDKQVPQCGWCMSGQMMTAAAFLKGNINPAEEEIIDAMSRNYCRCGCYNRIKDGVSHAAKLIHKQT